MAKVIVVGTSATIESIATIEEIKTLAKYAPEALELKDKESKQTIFKVATGKGCVEDYAVVFEGNSLSSGLACVTVSVPASTADIKAFVEENFGKAISRLNEVEAKFEETLASVTAYKQSVMDCIELG